jgi:glycosyltransferase involved in cell wall biosynthesis
VRIDDLPPGVVRKLKGARYRLRQFSHRLPAPVQAALVRRRHLAHVTINQGHLTDPAYLGKAPIDEVKWLNPDGLPDVPLVGLGFGRLRADAQRATADWIDANLLDEDAMLDRRLDNHGDEFGRTRAALRTRLRLHRRPDSPHWAGGDKVLFDARSLQSPAFGTRGIGRFAAAALEGARAAVDDADLVLLIDSGLEQIPRALAGECTQVTRVLERDVAQYSVLIQPSPMTASADPLIHMLHSNAHKVAVVFDFIPMHYPTIYLRHPAARAEYAQGLDALRLYDEFICISDVSRRELHAFLAFPKTHGEPRSIVAWPRDVLRKSEADTALRKGRRVSESEIPRIVVMTGDEPRKNTFGALAAIGAATSDAPDRDVVVLGMAGHGVRVHHWSIAAALRPGEAKTAERLSDDDMEELLASAALVVVASFDEGLSLPVIEALRSGAPVVASDIPAHRELIRSGSFLADPKNPRALSRAIRRNLNRAATQRRQLRQVARHRHAPLESAVAKIIHRERRPAKVALPAATPTRSRSRLSIGLATPWVPQRTGVADFSAAVGMELAEMCDLTVYTTSDARVPEHIRHRNVDEVLASPHEVMAEHDVFITVIGNSHFHLPLIELQQHVSNVAVAHDTRMVEYYMALRDKGGVQQVMLRGQRARDLDPSLDEQIDDMRLLQNAGFWEVARRADTLILHSPTAAPRIARETGVAPVVLPFANQRIPEQDRMTSALRADARHRLAFDDALIHLATFGFVDVRTKMSDVVVEAAAWLTQWGHRVALHMVGSASRVQARELKERAIAAGVTDFEITGFVPEQEFRDYLLAIDMGVQLRISPLLGVSGPLSDLAAFGTPAVASAGLCMDVDTPDYIAALEESVSPVTVAEAIETHLQSVGTVEERESARRAYLATKTPRLYAEQLMAVITQ